MRRYLFVCVRNKCAKCLGPLSNGEFVVNKEMAYCDDCATLLHLGESKESKMFQDFQDPVESPNARDSDFAGVVVDDGT